MVDLAKVPQCPICGGKEIARERRPNGNAKCENGHTYPMSQAIMPGVTAPAPKPRTPLPAEFLAKLEQEGNRLTRDMYCISRNVLAELVSAYAELRKGGQSVAITESSRGFHIYGEPVICTYGTVVKVYESSSASGPRVWLNLVCDPEQLRSQPSGEGTAHLNEEQARAVVARLQTWIDEIPTRWNPPQERENDRG